MTWATRGRVEDAVLLVAVDPAALKLLITFGSLIARTGLRGEADYGLSNEWLRGGPRILLTVIHSAGRI